VGFPCRVWPARARALRTPTKRMPAAQRGALSTEEKKRSLSDLPPEIGLLTQLNTLACHNNRLKYIPSEIGLCASLQVRAPPCVRACPARAGAAPAEPG